MCPIQLGKMRLKLLTNPEVKLDLSMNSGETLTWYNCKIFICQFNLLEDVFWKCFIYRGRKSIFWRRFYDCHATNLKNGMQLGKLENIFTFSSSWNIELLLGPIHSKQWSHDCGTPLIDQLALNTTPGV